MTLTEAVIHRPVLALVLNLLIVAFGIRAVTEMSVQKLPRFNSAVITVTTTYTGANAELVRGFITAPMERAISAADGIDYIESSSTQGTSAITAHLRLNADNNIAMTQITARVNEMRNSLPPEAEAPVIELQRADNMYGILALGFHSNTLNYAELTDYLVRVVQPILQSIPGVQKSDVDGGARFSLRVWLDPQRLAGYGLTPQGVQAALARNNYLSAIGQLKSDNTVLNLVANTDLRDVEEFRRIPVSERDGAVVRLADVAKVELGTENVNMIMFYDGRKGIFMNVWTLPDANTLEVTDAVYKKVEELRPRLPPGVEVSIPEDNSIFIRTALSNIFITLVETLLIVALVVYFFLGSWRSVLVPLAAIPVSLLGAAGLMLMFGFSLNLLTLLAVVLSVGLVVDDAIVVAENVERHIAEGASGTEAALKGARELTGPIIAMTITLAAVYAPIGFQQGLTGILFREFAMTLAGAVLVSGIVALTLSPIMSARLLSAADRQRPMRRRLDAAFVALRRVYAKLLTYTLQARSEVVIVTIFMIALIVPLYLWSGKELAPVEDRGIILVSTESAPDSSLEYQLPFAEQVQQVWLRNPNKSFIWQGVMPAASFSGFVAVPWDKRQQSIQEIMPAVYEDLQKVSGVNVYTSLGSPLPASGSGGVELVVMSEDSPEEMSVRVSELADRAVRSGRFLYADVDLKIDLPQAEIIFDRDKVADLGLDMETVGRDVAAMLGGDYVNRFNLFGRSYKVIPQIADKDRLNVTQLDEIHVSGPGNAVIPLSSVARVETRIVPRSLDRFQQRNAARIFGVAAPGYTDDEALRFVEQAALKVLPVGYTVDYAGASRQLRQEGNSLAYTLGFAVILIYLVLAAQFHSFRDPLIILLGSVPLAISGALIFPFLDFTTINIYSQIGLITLVGLVTKNGILIVQFANKLQEQGLSLLDAIHQSAITRLRPILITSAATVFGHVPLVLASGAGAEARNSIGIILVTGMTIGTLFTLFIVPTLYRVIAHRANLPASEKT